MANKTKYMINSIIIFLIAFYKFLLAWGVDNNLILYGNNIIIFILSIIFIIKVKFSKSSVEI